MPGSCSSNGINGCASCAPSLTLWVIEATSSESLEGYSCFDGSVESPVVKYQTYSENSSYSYHYDVVDAPDHDSYEDYSNSYNYTYSIIKFVDEYGNIISTNKYISKYNYSLYYLDSPYFYNFFTQVNGTIETNKAAKSQNDPFGPEPEPITTTSRSVSGLCSEEDPDQCPNDSGPPPTLPAGTPTSETESENIACKTSEYSIMRENPFILVDSSNDLYTEKKTISVPKSLSDINSLTTSSASKKMRILEDNDESWQQSAGYFSIIDNNLNDPEALSTTSQLLKFKISAIKEGFDKKYKSISGTVKFYYGGTEGKTPCCNDDFDGTVVKQAGYSISAGSTFKNGYLASDAGDFNNDDQSLVGQTINICYIIDSVSFI
jgi:hypothetical protein